MNFKAWAEKNMIGLPGSTNYSLAKAAWNAEKIYRHKSERCSSDEELKRSSPLIKSSGNQKYDKRKSICNKRLSEADWINDSPYIVAMQGEGVVKMVKNQIDFTLTTTDSDSQSYKANFHPMSIYAIY